MRRPAPSRRTAGRSLAPRPSPATALRALASPAHLSLALALLAGLLFRIWFIGQNAGLTMDSPLYVNMSEALVHGERLVGPAHHGYPVLVALFHLVVPGREWPGRMASLFLGLALLPMVWGLSRRALSPGWATLPVWLCALHPLLAIFSGTIMTEATFLALAYGAILLASRSALAAGALLGLAYTVRPEALVIAPVAAVLSPGGRRGALLTLAGFALIAGPYLGYLRWERGEWTLGPKTALVRPMFERPADGEWRLKSDSTSSVPEPTTLIDRLRWAAPSMVRHYVPNLRRHLDLLLVAWPVPLLILALVGLMARRWILLAPLVPLAVLPMLNVPFDLRFPQQFVPSLAVLAGHGGAWLAARAGARARLVAGAVVAVVVVGAWPWVGETRRLAALFDDGPIPQMREAGAWLKANAAPDAVVMDRKAFVPFFAGLRHVQLPDDDYDTLLEHARSSGVSYIVIEEYLVVGLRPQLLQLVQNREFRLREQRVRERFMTGVVPGTGIAVFEVVRDHF